MEEVLRTSYPQEKPTYLEIKLFWERFGFRYEYMYPGGRGNWSLITLPDGIRHTILHPELRPFPPLTMGSLYKWAVPRILEIHSLIESYSFKEESGLYYSETCVWDKDDKQLKGKLVWKEYHEWIELEWARVMSLYKTLLRAVQEYEWKPEMSESGS